MGERLRSLFERLRDLADDAERVRDRGQAWAKNYSASFAALGAVLALLLALPVLEWGWWGAGGEVVLGALAGHLVGRRRESLV